MADAFALYKRMMGGEKIEPTSDFDPSAEMCGFWRATAARTKPDLPLMIWPAEEDSSVFTFQFWKYRPKNSVDNPEDWHRLVTEGFFKLQAVSREEFDKALKGDYWPDGKPSHELTVEQKLDIIPTKPASEGGNMPEGEDQFFEQIKDKIASATEKAKALGNIDTLEKANELAGYVDTLIALGRKGEAQRKTEKQPHLDAAGAVDAKWKPILEPASDFIAHLKKLIQRFKDAEEARRREEQRKVEEAERERIRLETEKRLREEAEARAAEQAESGEEPDVPTEAAIAEEAQRQAAEAHIEQAPVEAPTVRSAHGRGISVAKKKVGVITDGSLFLKSLIENEDPGLGEWLQEKANRLARSGTTLPGMKIEVQ